MVAQNIAAQGRCLMLSELVLFRTGCMIVARHVINCGERGGGWGNKEVCLGGLNYSNGKTT